MQSVPNVRMLRGNEILSVGRTSPELFKVLGPNLDCPQIKSILSDMVFIITKKICWEAVKISDKFKRFDPSDISETIHKYICIYLDTNKDNNVLILLANVLPDMYLYEHEKKDNEMTGFISRIYAEVVELLP